MKDSPIRMLKIVILTLMPTMLSGCSYTPWVDAFSAGVLGAFQAGIGGVFSNIFFSGV